MYNFINLLFISFGIKQSCRVVIYLLMKIKLLKFKSVKSTNDTALRLIKSKYSKPTIVTSLGQTRGRGTMGKKN